MGGDRPCSPVLGYRERRIGCRLDWRFRAFDPVKEIIRRLPPNDQLEARFWPVTSYRSLAGPFTPRRVAVAGGAPGFRLFPQSGE
jgi:hypothetical protein